MDYEKILDHSGIPGMRWGIRKSEPSSGSSGPSKHGFSLFKKKTPMSDEELRTAISRIQLEKQYKDLTTKDTSGGRKFVNEIIVGAAKTTATTYVSKFMVNMVEKAITKAVT